MNVETLERFEEKECKKIPLNADAAEEIDLNPQSDSSDRGDLNQAQLQINQQIKQKYKRERQSDLDDVIRAGEFMRESIIQVLILAIDRLEIDIRSGEDLKKIMHSNGINIRFLGKISLEVIF